MIEESQNQAPFAVLIDFGNVTKYTDKKGLHLLEETSEDKGFKGNILFASKNQLEFKLTSRRDDIISLCYLMLYLVNDFVLPGYERERFKDILLDQVKTMEAMLELKTNYSLADMAKLIDPFIPWRPNLD